MRDRRGTKADRYHSSRPRSHGSACPILRLFPMRRPPRRRRNRSPQLDAARLSPRRALPRGRRMASGDARRPLRARLPPAHRRGPAPRRRRARRALAAGRARARRADGHRDVVPPGRPVPPGGRPLRRRARRPDRPSLEHRPRRDGFAPLISRMPYRQSAPAWGARFSALPILLLVAARGRRRGPALRGRPHAPGASSRHRPGRALRPRGRNATLALDARDATGLRTVKVTIRQGDKEQTIFDETYQPAADRGPPASGGRARRSGFRLKEGPGILRVEARNASWGNFFRGKTATLEKEFTARLDSAARRGPHHPALREPGRLRHGRLPGDAAGRGERRAGGRRAASRDSRCREPATPRVRFAIFAFPYDAPAAHARAPARPATRPATRCSRASTSRSSRASSARARCPSTTRS